MTSLDVVMAGVYVVCLSTGSAGFGSDPFAPGVDRPNGLRVFSPARVPTSASLGVLWACRSRLSLGVKVPSGCMRPPYHRHGLGCGFYPPRFSSQAGTSTGADAASKLA